MTLLLLAALLTPGRAAPPLAYRTAAGQVRRLATGRPLIVSFWASWCGPCREELPRLKRAAAKVSVLALNYGESPNTAQTFLKAEGLTGLPVGYVDAAAPKLWAIPGLPSSVLLDAGGRVVRLQYGPLSEATLNHWLTQAGR
ncbi:TlpA family protein disulfide reductase [Deinococcus sp.]|uniref:TlpA family protein disulfide reductase n=1 Tax=Deinococcus sp. TaxID=47478 RepID=UPI003CC551F9